MQPGGLTIWCAVVAAPGTCAWQPADADRANAAANVCNTVAASPRAARKPAEKWRTTTPGGGRSTRGVQSPWLRWSPAACRCRPTCLPRRTRQAPRRTQQSGRSVTQARGLPACSTAGGANAWTPASACGDHKGQLCAPLPQEVAEASTDRATQTQTTSGWGGPCRTTHPHAQGPRQSPWH